jgi:hypothetical protein
MPKDLNMIKLLSLIAVALCYSISVGATTKASVVDHSPPTIVKKQALTISIEQSHFTLQALPVIEFEVCLVDNAKVEKHLVFGINVHTLEMYQEVAYNYTGYRQYQIGKSQLNTKPILNYQPGYIRWVS